MDLLTLPRLDPAIPVNFSIGQSDNEMFLGVLESRVEHGLRLPAMAAGASATSCVHDLLQKQLVDTATSDLGVMPGGLCLHYSDDGMKDLELSWEGRSGDGYPAYIGHAIRRMEKSHPGLGQTVLHALDLAVDDLGFDIVLTPKRVWDHFVRDYWDDAFDYPHRFGADMFLKDPTAADLAVLEHLTGPFMEMDKEDAMRFLPSRIIKAIGQGIPSQTWLNPKAVLNVTQQMLLDAGFTATTAALIDRLINVDLPRDARKFSRAVKRSQAKNRRFDVGVTSYGESMLTNLVSLAVDPDDLDENVRSCIDEVNNGKLQAGEQDYTFTVRIFSSRQCGTGQGPHDPIAIMAAYLNLLRHTDQLLVALCD